MQRQQEAELRKKLEAEQKKKIDDSHWVVEGFTDESFPTVSLMNESTFDFSEGRKSFNSFNPAIEVCDHIFHFINDQINSFSFRNYKKIKMEMNLKNLKKQWHQDVNIVTKRKLM